MQSGKTFYHSYYKMILAVVTFSVLIVAQVKTVSLNPRGPIYQNYSTSCIVGLVNQHFRPRKQLLSVYASRKMPAVALKIQEQVLKEIHLLSKWPIEVIVFERKTFDSTRLCMNCPTDNGEEAVYKNFFQSKFKSKFILMVVDSLATLNRKVKLFDVTPHKFDAYVLVYFAYVGSNYKEMVQKVLLILWNKLGLFNTAVAVPKNNLQFVEVYGLNIYAQAERCGSKPELVLLSTCKKGKVKSDKLYETNIPANFDSCSLPAVALKYPPFVIDSEKGFEIDILKVLERHFNMVINVNYDDSNSEWGEKTEYGNWTGSFQVALEESALAVGNIVFQSQILEDFDVTLGYFVENMVWVVPVALPIPRWKNIFVILNFEVWVVSVVYWIFSAVCFQISSRSTDLRCYREFDTNLLLSFSALLSTSCYALPRTFYVRTFFITLVGFSLLLVALYQSYLITYLTNPILEKQISSLNDIFDSNKGIGGLETYQNFFYNENDPISMKIYNMFQTGDGDDDVVYEWLKKVASERDVCTITSRFLLRYSLAKNDPNFIDKHGKPKIVELSDVLFSYQVNMVVPKGFPMTEKFDHIIERLDNAGIVRHLALRYQYRSIPQKGLNASEEDDTIHDDEDAVSITIRHLSGAFFLWFFGITTAFVSFISELTYFKLDKTGRLKKIKTYVKQKIV